ncbi:hypothetical protein ACFXA8_08415, partial [Streptomyces sp. NPDC059409]
MDDVSDVGEPDGGGDEARGPEHGPLAGFTVGVTAARRADELGALLQRRGAAVLHAPALRIVPRGRGRGGVGAAPTRGRHAPPARRRP